jgi:hypothetical protein
MATYNWEIYVWINNPSGCEIPSEKKRKRRNSI